MAGFQATIHGRFWVTAEVIISGLQLYGAADRPIVASKRASRGMLIALSDMWPRRGSCASRISLKYLMKTDFGVCESGRN